ncbi:hypothetical protein [Deinococcus irradiatisoli]|nr:hypothetical protein [Deinococcus irradiatisoli]
MELLMLATTVMVAEVMGGLLVGLWCAYRSLADDSSSSAAKKMLRLRNRS